MKQGICVAGNMIIDILYNIEGYPNLGELTTVQDNVSRSTGGALCNVIVDLAKLDESLPLTALGMVGKDKDGEFILSCLREHANIDCARIARKGVTSFTAVMNDVHTNQRSFFHCRGANALFDESGIDWEGLDCELLHIGYMLLLDALDQEDGEYGTKMARLLYHAQQRGIKTSIDVVSETGSRFRAIVPPALRYTDYCIINELEAEHSTGVKLHDENGLFLKHNVKEALVCLKKLGVSTWAVIHCPEGGFGLDEHDSFVSVVGISLPEGYIKGTVGAGDAFCSGVLYAAYRKWSLAQAIELGTAAAVCSLSRSGATEGMLPVRQALELYRCLNGNLRTRLS